MSLLAHDPVLAAYLDRRKTKRLAGPVFVRRHGRHWHLSVLCPMVQDPADSDFYYTVALASQVPARIQGPCGCAVRALARVDRAMIGSDWDDYLAVKGGEA